MPDELGNPTQEELIAEVIKEEFRQAGKSEAKQITWMWIKFLTPANLALLAILTVGALNIPAFTDANTRLSETLASMHPWNTQQNPSWSVLDVAPSSRYLRMEFVTTTFYRKLLDMGWSPASAQMMMRVRVPNAVEGEVDIRYYSPWIGTTPPGVDTEGKFVWKFSQHNLPPIGAPDGTLTDGASYQCEIRMTMQTEDASFYREFVITTDWYEYVATP